MNFSLWILLFYEVVGGSVWILLVLFSEILTETDFEDEIQLKWEVCSMQFQDVF